MHSDYTVDLPLTTRHNGTLWLHVVVAERSHPTEWRFLKPKLGPTVVQHVALTDYMVPQAKAFNLLGDEATGETNVKTKTTKPLSKKS